MMKKFKAAMVIGSLFFTINISMWAQSTKSVDVVLVKGGSFSRDGSKENMSSISSYYIGKFEITRKQFLEVTGLEDPSILENSSSVNDPVQQTSWYHAIVFCNMLSMIENLTPIYEIGGKTDPKEWGIIPDQRNELWDAVIWNSNANGYRLPTEMEWIWAAMGADANNTKNDRFSGDNGKNNIEDYSWYRNNSAGTTHPVGIKLPNNLGIFDMSGNVWEWIWDWSTIAWPKGKLIDYHGTDSGIERKVRGGAWYNPDFCQSIGGISGASSGGMDPSIRTGNFVGFRIARSK